MLPSATSEPALSRADFRYRCIGCGDLSDTARPNFRCPQCGELLEITYPDRKLFTKESDVKQLKSTWKQRRLSSSTIDRSGVWRFREVLPTLAKEEKSGPLCEGHTPLYELQQCPRLTGVPRLF